MIRGGEPGHVQAGLGDDRAGQFRGDPGDLVQPAGHVEDGCVRAGPGTGAGDAVGVGAPRSGQAGELLGDQNLGPGDLPVQEADLLQQHPGDLGVMVLEPALQRLHQGVVLRFHPGAGQPGQDLRVTFAADQRGEHVPHRLGGQLRRHRRHLDQGFSELCEPSCKVGCSTRSWQVLRPSRPTRADVKDRQRGEGRRPVKARISSFCGARADCMAAASC